MSWEWTGGNHIEEECLSPAALEAAAAAGPVSGSRPVPWCAVWCFRCTTTCTTSGCDARHCWLSATDNACVHICRSYYQNVVTSSYSYAWYAALHTVTGPVCSNTYCHQANVRTMLYLQVGLEAVGA